MFISGITIIPVHSDNEFFRIYKEIYDKIIELMGINGPRDFVEIDDDEDEFIMLQVEKNTSAIRDKYRNDLVFVYTSVVNNFLQTSLGQYRC